MKNNFEKANSRIICNGEGSTTYDTSEIIINGRFGITINDHPVFGEQVAFSIFSQNVPKITQRKTFNAKYNRTEIFLKFKDIDMFIENLQQLKKEQDEGRK